MREKPANGFEDTPNVPEFLNHDSPSRSLPGLDSPPLFPRIAQGRFTHRDVRSDGQSGARNLIRGSDLASMLKVAPKLIDDIDGNIDDHHMAVVSGWSGFTSPRWI